MFRWMISDGVAIQGEAMMGGPVILAWDAALAGGREELPGNVVFHELAHKIDMANGAVDGAPPFETRAELRRWSVVCSAAFARLRHELEAGWPTVIDPYGATNEAEFFAVATETYFTRPGELRAFYPRALRGARRVLSHRASGAAAAAAVFPVYELTARLHLHRDGNPLSLRGVEWCWQSCRGWWSGHRRDLRWTRQERDCCRRVRARSATRYSARRARAGTVRSWTHGDGRSRVRRRRSLGA
jgi:Glucose-regulated metallo-peptidase M90